MGKLLFNVLKVLERLWKVELKFNYNNKDYDNWCFFFYIVFVLIVNGLKLDFSRFV